MSATIDTKGQPWINGKPAMPCGCEAGECLSDSIDTLSRWRCPECDAHLTKGGICLNACHLTAASFRRFQSSLRHAQPQE